MRKQSSAALAAAVLSFTALASPAAQAKDDLLETLAQKGVISVEEYEKLKAQQPKPGPVFSTDDGLKLASADGAFSLQVGTLQQIDFAAYDADGTDLADGSQLRRSRLSLGGTLFKDWQYRFEYEFAKSAAVTPITDAYVVYNGFKPFTVTIGQFKPPFSLEALTADKSATFMERGLPFYLISPLIVRAPGVQLADSGARWSAAAGIFGEPLGNGATGDEGWGVAARGTLAPYLAEQRVVHLGLGLTWHKTTADNSGTTPPTSSIAFTAKPESDQAPSFLNTKPLLDTDSYRFVGAELATAWGPASLQGEYDWVNVARDHGSDDLAFSTWYAQLAYTLTGEVRPYKVGRGVFDGVKPAHPLGSQGWGAFELAARVSQLDLNDGSVAGGLQRDLTLGGSWYLNRYMRVSANYVKVLKLDGGSFDDQQPAVYQMRLQLAL